MYGVSDLFPGAWHLIKDPIFPPTSRELNDRLEEAVRYDQTLPAIYALKKGAHPETEYLFRAAEKGNTRLLKALVRNGGDPNTRQRFLSLECTPLFLAIENGHTKTVKALLENGADVYRTILTQNSGAGTGHNQTTSPLPLEFAKKHKRLPLTRMIAIVPKEIETGMELTPELEKKIPEIVALIKKEIDSI